MLGLVWPARPHTILSCATESVWVRDDWVFFRPGEHKRTPTDFVFRVKLPAEWLAVFARFLELSKGFDLLFSVDGEQTENVFVDAFRMYL